jgi:AbiV family abortive infection protein
METPKDKYFSKIADALSKYHDDFVGFRSSGEYDEACSHVLGLVRDAFLLFSNGSYFTSLFLSIFAIEECAKAEIGLYRRENTEKVKRREDPMFSHDGKYLVAASPVILIGDRLKQSLGEEMVNQIFKKLWDGKYRKIREDALYMKRDTDRLTLPSSLFAKDEAKSLLLTAIEIIDDRLVGYTTQSFIFCEELEVLYEKTDSL